jgi:hypothetical protein
MFTSQYSQATSPVACRLAGINGFDSIRSSMPENDLVVFERLELMSRPVATSLDTGTPAPSIGAPNTA